MKYIITIYNNEYINTQIVTQTCFNSRQIGLINLVKLVIVTTIYELKQTIKEDKCVLKQKVKYNLYSNHHIAKDSGAVSSQSLCDKRSVKSWV